MNEELLFTFLRESLYPDLVKSEASSMPMTVSLNKQDIT
jgi:hypothetical protein